MNYRYILYIHFALTLPISAVFPRTFYFSMYGDDRRTSTEAQNLSTPWRTIQKLNTLNLLPGDTILFKCEEVYYGSINVRYSGTSVNNIVFSSYGIGQLPVIYGSMQITEWIDLGKDIYKSQLNEEIVGVMEVFFNNVPGMLARYPNKKYLLTDGGSENRYIEYKSVLDYEMDTGFVEAVIKTERFFLEKKKISQFAQGRLKLISPTEKEIRPGWGFFLQNDKCFLDTIGEWWYNTKSKELYVYSPENISMLNVDAVVANDGISIRGQKHISISNLEIMKFSDNALYLSDCEDISISLCHLSFVNLNGIKLERCSNIKMDSNSISHCNSNGIQVYFGKDIIVESNSINSIGLKAGRGEERGGSKFIGINFPWGNTNSRISRNIIDSIGYTAIQFHGENIIVEKNIVYDYCQVLDDGGGIFIAVNKDFGNIIKRNIIMPRTVPNITGTNHNEYSLIEGIYVDWRSANILIDSNTVTNTDDGIKIHNSSNITISNNICYNNRNSQLTILEGHPFADERDRIRGLDVVGNTFACGKSAQRSLMIFSHHRDLGNIGEFKRNAYINLFHVANTVAITYFSGEADQKKVDRNDWSFIEWQKYSGTDLDSWSNKEFDEYNITKWLSEDIFAEFTEKNERQWGLWSTCKDATLSEERNQNNIRILYYPNDCPQTENAIIYSKLIPWKKGATYALSFNVKSDSIARLEVLPRSAYNPYNLITTSKKITLIPGINSRYNIIFASNSDEKNGKIDFRLSPTNVAMTIDNPTLNLVSARKRESSDLLVFVVNKGETPVSKVEYGLRFYDWMDNQSLKEVSVDSYYSKLLFTVPIN